MSVSRSESQAPQYGRKRSNTVQSIYKSTAIPALPLKLGDSKQLTTWVHDPKDSPTVILNQTWWPGVAEGDMLQLTAHASASSSSGMLFIVPKEEAQKHQLQVFLSHFMRCAGVTYAADLYTSPCSGEVWGEEQRGGSSNEGTSRTLCQSCLLGEAYLATKHQEQETTATPGKFITHRILFHPVPDRTRFAVCNLQTSLIST